MILCKMTGNGLSDQHAPGLLFASFFRPHSTKFVLGYNKDKIVLAFAKNSRFEKIHSLLK